MTPLRRALTAGLVSGVLALHGPVAAAAPAEPGLEDDAGVVAAQRHLDEVGARLAALEAELDEAASAYERAAAHHERLAGERSAVDRRVAGALSNIDQAEAILGRRMVELYRRPYETLAVAGAVVTGGDVGSALHGAALLEHATTRGALAVDRAREISARTADDARQHEIVAAGSAGSAAEREAAAARLTRAVEAAGQQVRGAEAALGQARDGAARRLAAERRAAEEAALQVAREAAPRVTGSLVDGKVCPVGTPNGFIDSWGYPRSGGRRHQGVDMFAPYGTPLYAVADGTIRRVGNNRLGGLSLHLVDERGDRYYYAHLSSVAVKTGQGVRVGDVVGANGDSGNARGTPPHLHWEYHPGGGAAVNPYPLAAALCRK